MCVCAKQHRAGTTCTAYSKQSLQLGEQDKTVIPFCAWVGMRLLLQEPDITQENVKQFNPVLLGKFLSKYYFIDSEVLCPSSYGWSSRRERRWTRLRHRFKILCELSPLSRFSKRFLRACNTHWREFFCLHKYPDYENPVIDQELQKELAWAQNRKLSCAYSEPPLSISDFDPFWKALNRTEQAYDQEYCKSYAHEARQLNQDPKSGHGMHSNNNLLHTLIRNMGLIFSSSHDNDDHRRWLCGTEALISQAFPVHPEFRAANDVILTSFNTLRPRKPRIICGQAGNSMNINIAFIVELHSWF